MLTVQCFCISLKVNSNNNNNNNNNKTFFRSNDADDSLLAE